MKTDDLGDSPNIPKMKMSDLPWVECEDGNKMFEMKYLFKRVSPLISPSGKEEYMPIEVLVCTKCGKIPKFIWETNDDIPVELRSGYSPIEKI